ncbi:MAG: hypothetical protein E7157_05755 [Lactobacillales bacterium]|nr:hypothetical protein [Lactobacillales bacterium]
MVTNNNNEKKYIDKFYDPNFSAYDFMSLFSAISAEQKVYSFNEEELNKFIKECKDSSEFDNLLNDINFKSNGISYYSEELDEAITKLKFGNILYTITPQRDSIIYIFENTPFSKMIDSRRKYLDEATSFINKYKEFENKNEYKRKIKRNS